MKAFTVSVLFGIVFFVQITSSYGRENIDRPFYEEELDAAVQSIYENAKEDETDSKLSKHINKNVYEELEKNVRDQNEGKKKEKK